MTEKSKIDDLKQKAQLVLGTMLDYLGLEADLSSEEKGNKLIIKITSNDVGRIIGRRGNDAGKSPVTGKPYCFQG